MIIQLMNMKVFIFSHRPWPNTANMDINEREDTHKKWNDIARTMIKDTYCGKSLDSFFGRTWNLLKLRLGYVEYHTSDIPWYRMDTRLACLARHLRMSKLPWSPLSWYCARFHLA